MWSIVVGSLLAAAPLELSTLGKGDGLVELVWRQSPTLQSARARVAEAEAERRRTLRLPNPGLDLSVNTLPIGPLNPPDLQEPFLNVPNVSVGLSVLLELGKRGPRQDAAAEAARASVLLAIEALRNEVFALEEVLGDVAAAQVRVATLESLADDAHRLSELQAARAQKGDASELDADRSRLEEAGTVSLLGAARDELASSLRACAALVATPCRPFADAPQAGAWLDRVGQPGEIARRPDMLALEAAARSARASERLVRRGWIPDPTVRVGYVRDQFVISGNQLNSLFVGLSMPLNVFDHGQDAAEAAAITARSIERERERLVDAAGAQLEQLTGELAAVESRQQRLRTEALPLARTLVERLTAAVTKGAAPLQELLLARRSLADLSVTAAELDRTLFRLHLARARLTGTLDGLPQD